MSDFNIQMDIVNEDDEISSQDYSEFIHKKHQLHRAIHILVVNDQGEIFVRQRSFQKELYPGVWSTSVGEHVQSGQSYDETATRALKDFLGLDLQLECIGKIRVEDSIENELVSVYVGKVNTIPLINLEHMEKGEFVDLSSIELLIQKNEITPHLAECIKLYQKLH